MRIEMIEKIIMSKEESELWDNFDKLLGEIRSEVSSNEIDAMIGELQKIMSILGLYVEEE